MRSVRARTGMIDQAAASANKAGTSYSARSNSALKKVTTLTTAKYGPGETRTLAIEGFFSARSRSSLPPAKAGRLFSSLGSFICPLLQTDRGSQPATRPQKYRARCRVQCNASQPVERESASCSLDLPAAPRETAQNRET